MTTADPGQVRTCERCGQPQVFGHRAVCPATWSDAQSPAAEQRVTGARRRLIEGYAAGYEWVNGAEPSDVDAFEAAIKAEATRELAARILPVLERWRRYSSEFKAAVDTTHEQTDAPSAYLLGKAHAYANAIRDLEVLVGIYRGKQETTEDKGKETSDD